MAQMMQIIMRMSQEKGVVDDAGSVNTAVRVQGATEGPMCHPASLAIPEVRTHHCPIPPMVNVVPKIHPPPLALMPFREVYTYPYMPPPIVSSTLVA